MSPESARLAAERIEREGAVRWRDENVLHWLDGLRFCTYDCHRRVMVAVRHGVAS